MNLIWVSSLWSISWLPTSLVYCRLGLCYYLKYSCLHGDTPPYRPSANCLSASIDVRSKNSISNALMESASKTQQTSLQKKKEKKEVKCRSWSLHLIDKLSRHHNTFHPAASQLAALNNHYHCLSQHALRSVVACALWGIPRWGVCVCVWNCCHVFHWACYAQTALWDPDGVPCQRLRGTNNFRSNIN